MSSLIARAIFGQASIHHLKRWDGIVKKIDRLEQSTRNQFFTRSEKREWQNYIAELERIKQDVLVEQQRSSLYIDLIGIVMVCIPISIGTFVYSMNGDEQTAMATGIVTAVTMVLLASFINLKEHAPDSYVLSKGQAWIEQYRKIGLQRERQESVFTEM